MAIDASEISRVSDLVSDLARRDVSALSHTDLLAVHDAAARLERLAGTLSARCAGEIARRSLPEHAGGGLARQQGYGTASAMVASITGGSRASALRAIEAGLALMPSVPHQTGFDQAGTSSTRYPAVAKASLAGDLSVDAAGIITAGLETIAERVPANQLHDVERRLVDKAVHLAAHDVRRMAAIAIARADLEGHEEREKRRHDERYLAWTEDHAGVVTFTGKLDAVTAAPIRTAIEQMVTHGFRARREQYPTSPDQRTVGQMRADALFELCRHALGCKSTERSGVRTTMVVRMNLVDLEAGRGLGSIDGTAQPVSVRELRRLAGDAGLVPEVLGRAGEVLDLGRTVRSFTPAQRLALLERDGGCARCHAPPEHCEAHHIRWWELGGRTDLANGVMLCTRCHHDVHRQGWEILVHDGRVSFVPPSTIDPLRRARLGGRAAMDLGSAGTPADDRATQPQDAGSAREAA